MTYSERRIRVFFFHEQSNDCVTTPKNERFHYRLKLAQVYIVLLFIVSKKWDSWSDSGGEKQ